MPMRYTQLADKMAISPWPSGTGPTLFLLDASNSVEQQLLETWIDQHQPEGRKCARLTLPLRDDRKPIVQQPLSKQLDSSDDWVVAPLRVAWMPDANALETGPRLSDLVWGNRNPGPWRGRHILRSQPDRVHLIAGAPAQQSAMAERYTYQYALHPGQHQEDFAVFVARQGAIVLDMAERRLRGGRYKVPRYVAQSLRNNQAFKEQLSAISKERKVPRSIVIREVDDYFGEMISIPTSFWLDVWMKFCNFCLGLGYEPKLYYRAHDLERIRGIVRHHPSALLWTHKTYIDGFVVPKILFDNDFPVPHFFGGANLNIPLLGFLVRRAGGIFIKRSFSDNEAYKAALRQYIGYLMEKRFPLTWSFEGTRSRLGKLMPPKYGVLKYVLEGCYNSDAQNVHIIPVTVSYDLIRDAEEYAKEQAGVPKAPESLRWLVGYVRSLARPMGKIYVDFGEPVVLPEAPAPDDRLALSKIAFQVAVEANRVTPITYPAVVCMALLGVYPRALTETEVSEEVDRIVTWARERSLRMSLDFDRQHEAGIDKLLQLMIDENILTRFDGGPTTVYGVAAGRAAVASYYRNTIVHYFVNKAIIELALIALSDIDAHDSDGTALFWREVNELRDLFKFEFFYPPTEIFHEEIIEELNRALPTWQEELQRGAKGARKLLLSMSPQAAHMVLQIFVESYSLGADLLLDLAPHEALDENDFIERCMNYGRQAYLQRRVASEASMGKLLFKNAWTVFTARGLTNSDNADVYGQRQQQQQQLQTLVRRVEVCRATSIASRTTPTTRDAVRAEL